MTNTWRAAAAALGVLLWADSAAAQQHDRVEWHESWRPFQWWNYATSAVLLGGAIGIGLGTDFQEEGHRGGVLFDEPLREAFMLRTRAGRDVARSIGDRLYQGSLVYPHLVDALLVAGVAHESWGVAAQIFLINVQSQSLSAIISLATEHFIGRARPSTEPCESNPQYERFCNGSDENGSFISGHTSMAMTSAGLVCAHHQKLPLYGGGAPDVAACITGIVLASSTGIMRMINDRHWATDVISGAAVGTLSGYVVPMLLHYGFADGPLTSDSGVAHLLWPTASRDRLGVAWLGAF